MRLVSPGGGGGGGGGVETPWGRNPQRILLSGEVRGDATQGTVERGSYTVPAARRAILYGAVARIWIPTAPAVLQDASTQVLFTPSGGAEQTLISARWGASTSALNIVIAASPILYLVTGDLVRVITTWVTNGGSLNASWMVSLVEFDA